MFCNNCGASISGNSAFCEQCGAALSPSVNGNQFNGGQSGQSAKKNNKIVIIVIAVVCVLLIVITILVTVLIMKGNSNQGNTSAAEYVAQDTTETEQIQVDSSDVDVSVSEVLNTETTTEEVTTATPVTQAPVTQAPALSVSFKRWDDYEYTYIDYGSASLGVEINAGGKKIAHVGITIYNSSSVQIAKYDHIPASTSTTHFYFDTFKELGIQLARNTTYKYRFYCIVDGKEFQSDTYSFTTLSEDLEPTFTKWENSNYTFIGRTNAALGVQITPESSFYKLGIELYDENYNFLKGCEAMGVANETKYFFDVNDEIGYVLQPGTTYRYRFWSVQGKKDSYSQFYTFTTKY